MSSPWADSNRRVIHEEQIPSRASDRHKVAGKAEISDAEFRRRLNNIPEWRRKRLAQLRAEGYFLRDQ